MFLRLLGFLVFFVIGMVVWTLIKLIFHLGRTSGQLNNKFDDMQKNRTGKGAGRKGKVIELDRDQYKVE
ncbi:MAG TPA: hypothetical protein PK358_07505 [Spirochaetota bacterium]|nr:hypothetical protein [Spirochaetota bacterium]HPJ34666.1 hypothetical protein [Spirochaetota bacterium]